VEAFEQERPRSKYLCNADVFSENFAKTRQKRRMVEQIGLNWNTLLPFLAELAQAGQEKAEIQERAFSEGMRKTAVVRT